MDRGTHDDSIYCASIASRGKNGVDSRRNELAKGLAGIRRQGGIFAVHLGWYLGWAVAPPRKVIIFSFLPRDAMLARYVLSSYVCPVSIRPSHASVVSKRLNVA